MIILGIDQGLANVGYAIVSSNEDQLILHTHGYFKTQPKHETGDRLFQIYKAINQLIDLFEKDVGRSIDGIALEQLFIGINKTEGMYHRSSSIVNTSLVTGVLQLLSSQRGLKTYSLAPSSVKKNICFNGKASKEEVKEAVEGLFKGEDFKVDHECDAVAIACTCINQLKGKGSV